MLGNVLLFVPFGTLMSILDRHFWRVFFIGLIFSCSIELVQFLLKIGLCELDDVFHNTLGTLIGLYFGKKVTEKRKKEQDK